MAYRFVTDGDYVNFYDGDSPVVRLHNTSRCISWRFDDTSGIIFNIDNFEFQTDAMSNILFDDVECTTQASFQTNIESMFPDMAGGGGGGSSYLVYTALLSQSGTDAPVATVLENTIGDIVWSYTGVGIYTGTLSGAFPLNKTFFSIVPNGIFVFAIGSNEDGEPSNSIYVQTAVPSSGESQNGVLYSTSIEIRVYP